MSLTASQLERAGHYSLDANLRNNPIDQIGQDRPLLAWLMKNAKSFPGGKQYVRENIRTNYDSNFQWFTGDAEVTYNKRDPDRQAQYPWKEAHDGFSLNERELFANGIVIADSAPQRNAGDEADRLVDLLDENVLSLREGFEDKFDYTLHQDGTQDDDAVAGIDFLIATSPTSGTVGGIDRANAEYWRNYAKTGISTATAGTLIEEMEKGWRACTRHRGQPDFILAGEDFLDAFRKDAGNQITRYLGLNGIKKGSAAANLDPSSDLFFHGIPVMRDPTALDLDDALSPTVPWQQRCYFLNSKTIRLRPAKGHNMVTRKPPRVYNRYAYYWGLTWKGALTCSKPNANAVLAISS